MEIAAVMQDSKKTVVNKEISFELGELFFSRTDDKGRILSGNSVFQKISQYSWDELIGKPHNIIRHPDMPRAVFWLLWDTIKRGEPIGAYVKNRAKDGRYYWVFALVTPIEGGYLSVRLKPSSAIWQTVEQEYKALLAIEQNDKLKPAESARLLLDRLAELGFRDYQAFMSAALAQEMLSRNQKLGRPRDAIIPQIDILGKGARELLKQAEIISENYASSRYIPLNLRVQAAQLGEAAATIGVISVNYSIIAGEIKTLMDQLVASAHQVTEAVNKGMFLYCTSELQQETVQIFQGEASEQSEANGENFRREMARLHKQHKTYMRNSGEGLQGIAEQSELFYQSCAEMLKLAAGLEVTRVMANIESARLSTTHNGLNTLSASLAQFQASISSGLNEIASQSRFIKSTINKLIERVEAPGSCLA
jgi:PAS domain S-box-containing protein